jgi:hypothetical protein
MNFIAAKVNEESILLQTESMEKYTVNLTFSRK